jgi:hypothetical protein
MEEDAVSARFNPWVYSGKDQTVPKNVVSVRFHPSVAAADGAFNGCMQLREIVLNEGLTTIEGRAFDNCMSLQSIIFPSTLTEIGECAFTNCIRLREVVFNEGLRGIGNKAFWGCMSLESISLPSTIISISRNAFMTCSNLSEVLLDERIKGINRTAFSDCPRLEKLSFPHLSTRVEVSANCQAQVENKIDEIGLEKDGTELFISAETLSTRQSLKLILRQNDSSLLEQWRVGNDNWNSIRESLDQVVSWIRYYEIKENMPLFELALWKAKIDQSGATSIAKREAYRIEVPGPVKDAILQYL